MQDQGGTQLIPPPETPAEMLWKSNKAWSWASWDTLGDSWCLGWLEKVLLLSFARAAPSGSWDMRAQNVHFYRPSRSRHTKEKIFRRATCKSWVISRSWKSGVKCCYQTLDSAAITVYKNGNRAHDKLTEPKPKWLKSTLHWEKWQQAVAAGTGTPGSLVVHQVPGKLPCCHGTPVSLQQCLPEALLCKRYG